MNKIYKSFLALAAFLAFGALVSAQDNPYLMDFGKGIAYNKTVITDPTTGQHTIRLETFAMGGGERKAIPSDIVLVLDNSGSMLYYYLPSGNTGKYKTVLTQGEVDAGTTSGDPLLVEETLHYIESYSYQTGGFGEFGDSNGNTGSSYRCFYAESSSSLANAFRYAKYNGKYYRIFQRMETHDGLNWYYICFRLDDGNPGTLMYLRDDSFTSTRPTDDCYKGKITTANPKGDNPNKILYKGSKEHGNGGLLYRAVNRMDKLVDGVNLFIDEIAANNAAIEDDLGGKVGNQIAIVAFGSNKIESPGSSYPSQTAPVHDPSTYNSRIIKTLTPVKDDSGSRVSEIKHALDSMSFNGNTSIGYGFMLAEETFNLLRYGSTTPGDPTTGNKAMDSYEMDSEGHYLNQNGEPISGTDQPVLNRSKIVVMFTDGEPTSERPFNPANPYYYDPNSTTGSTYLHDRFRALYFSNLIKHTEPGSHNGKIFTVGLTPNDGNKAFLQHLSSDYKDDCEMPGYDATSTSTSTPPASAYSGTRVTTNKYYMDAGVTDLTEVFKSIASVSGGSSSVNSTNPINVDIVSKSFQIEGGALADNISLSIAQCLGLDPDHTFQRNGATKHYLAFAAPVPITDSRCSNIRLWVEPTSEGGSWEPVNQNLSNEVSVTVTAAGKITVSGFDYGKYWCGYDDPAHDNGRLYDPADYGDYYLGTGTFVDGYRGFKLIIDIPIVLQENAIGGPKVETNEAGSGLYDPSDLTEPMIAYPIPTLTISPVNLVIKKEGLKKGENATFTILRKDANVAGAEYEPYTRMIVTGQSDASGNSVPVTVKLLNLDAGYYYKIEEDGWSWSYTKPEAPTTETVLENPIVITNTLKPGNQPKHAESVAKNQMGTSAGTGGSTTTVSTREHTIVTTP